MLLAPAAGELQGRRIAVVADGVLGQVPFVLLPEPASQDSLLLTGHEVVHLPSAAVLVELRRELERRSAPSKRLAVLADPIVSLSDSRLPPTTGTLPLVDPGKVFGFRRFIGSNREARGIVNCYPPDESLMAMGTFANRSLFMDRELSRYGTLHLAVPVHLETDRADESSLVLSMFDEQGRPQNGVIPGYELFGLRLPFDLVVLSSGRTAFGKPLPGEGFAGLAQAFFAAGAIRVVDTLWDIDDQSAADLMVRFHGQLASGAPPASALRRAQLEMMSMATPQLFPDWAAFRLEGDWR
jgi:CHAT domain-containing protein